MSRHTVCGRGWCSTYGFARKHKQTQQDSDGADDGRCESCDANKQEAIHSSLDKAVVGVDADAECFCDARHGWSVGWLQRKSDLLRKHQRALLNQMYFVRGSDFLEIQACLLTEPPIGCAKCARAADIDIPLRGRTFQLASLSESSTAD